MAKIAMLRPTNTQRRGPPPQVSPNSCLGVSQRRCKPILAPTTPYCHYSDMRKSLKKQNPCEKRAKSRFSYSRTWRVEGFRPILYHHIGRGKRELPPGYQPQTPRPGSHRG